MYYLNSLPNDSGNYGNPMGQPFNNCIQLPEELLGTYLDSNGFVTLTIEDNVVTNVERNTTAYNAYQESLPPVDNTYHLTDIDKLIISSVS